MMPELMNCPHDPEGWCLDCLKTMVSRDEVAVALEELRDKVQIALTAETLDSLALRQEIMIDGIDVVITKLGLAPGKNGVKMTNETVTISKAEYDRMKKDSEWLGYLESAGVDNWPGYSEAGAMRRADRESDSGEGDLLPPM